MPRTPLTLLTVYGLIGLAVAGGVVTFTEITSKVVPVFPRNGQLRIGLSMVPTIESSDTGTNPVNSAQNFTLRITTGSVMVHRSGEFNFTSGWIQTVNQNETLTLKTGSKAPLADLKLPEGNITMIKISILSAAIQRSQGTTWESVRIPSDDLKLPLQEMVRAQGTTEVVVRLHLVCPGSAGNGSTGNLCLISPVADIDD